MKILWFSNVKLSSENINSSGTWIHSMFEALRGVEGVQIVGNITIGDCGTSEIQIIEKGSLKEYFVPKSSLRKNGLPNKKITHELINIINSINADLLHVWGMELFWGTLLKKINPKPAILEIQGIKSEVSKSIYFNGGLDSEVLSKYGLIEIIFAKVRHNNLRKSFRRWGDVENEMLSYFDSIDTQSHWVREVIKSKILPTQKIYSTGIILRDEFTNSSCWHEKHIRNRNPIIFSLTAPRVYKGLHLTLECLALIKRVYPDAKLRIAGVKFPHKKYLWNAYFKYLQNLIRTLDLQNSVEFLGNLEAPEIVEEMYNCDVYINTTFVETYCLSLAEAMSLGVPCVATDTSALKELIIDGVDGFLFPMGDKYLCADKILTILKRPELAKQISINASDKLRKKSDATTISNNQIRIYQDVLNRWRN